MTMNDTESKKSPSRAMMLMLAPDGYYNYLEISKDHSRTGKETGDDSLLQIDPDIVKRNYRKLSIKHHPDKPGGDADTFRVLKRAQTVLSNPKLREQVSTCIYVDLIPLSSVYVLICSYIYCSFVNSHSLTTVLIAFIVLCSMIS